MMNPFSVSAVRKHVGSVEEFLSSFVQLGCCYEGVKITHNVNTVHL
jgi:hypothetical protein